MNNCDALRARFENREAIYAEKGALRVRVFNLCCDASQKTIKAAVEEIPTPGPGVGIFSDRRSDQPLSWNIGAGILSQFSTNTWSMGYGEWTLYFEKKIIDGIVLMASSWPNDLADWDRYQRRKKWIRTNEKGGKLDPVFPDWTSRSAREVRQNKRI